MPTALQLRNHRRIPPKKANDPALLPPGVAADGTVRRFLEEAVLRFGELGYYGVSVRDIAEAVGVKPSALYAHFPSKQALLDTVITLAHEFARDELFRAAEEAGRDPVARLRAVVIANVRMHGIYPRMAMVANHEMHGLSSKAMTTVAALRDACQQLVADVIDEGVRARAFTCRDPELAMRAIGGMCIRVASWSDQSPRPIDTVAEMYADFAVNLVS